MIKEINSAANPFVKQLRALATSKKARQESSTFILEGWRGIETLLKNDSCQYRLETLVISESFQKEGQLPEEIDTVQLPDPLFDRISDVKNAQGILAIIHHTPVPFKFRTDTGHYLLLDQISDPGNLGTLIRSAVGAGFDGILLHGDCVEPFNPKVVRSTMGTFAFASIHRIADGEIEEMIKAGYELCVTTGRGGDNLYEAAFSKKNLLVIGSEAHGVSDVLMQRASKKITIPLAAACESLNAAIAGSICMFQMRNRAK
ncbi:MAG: RNA methyltransferase [Pontiella sp.]|nr:RNA methyltransferase [Pontiella sp.]NNJ70635.1 RNA methyltransferase [Kiritimatiellales bacterium]